jgi:hypothetical protein
MSLATCRECQGQVSTEAASCPHCGAPRPVSIPPEPTAAAAPSTKKRRSPWRLVILGGFGLLVISWVVGSLSSSQGPGGLSRAPLALVGCSG